MNKTLIAKNRDELLYHILNHIEEYGKKCDLNHIDTSRVTDMHSLFGTPYLQEFNGNISQWDVSNVTNMKSMFRRSSFCGDISNWNVSCVKNMVDMFNGSRFNGNISQWNTHSLKDMAGMFQSSHFRQDINLWNVENVEDMSWAFCLSNFSSQLNLWKPFKLKKFKDIFSNTSFDLPYWIELLDIDLDSRYQKILKYHLTLSLTNQLDPSSDDKYPLSTMKKNKI